MHKLLLYIQYTQRGWNKFLNFVPMIDPEILSFALFSNNFIFWSSLKIRKHGWHPYKSAVSFILFTPLYPAFYKICHLCTVTKLQEIIYIFFFLRNCFYEIYICSRLFVGVPKSMYSEFIYYVWLFHDFCIVHWPTYALLLNLEKFKIYIKRHKISLLHVSVFDHPRGACI